MTNVFFGKSAENSKQFLTVLVQCQNLLNFENGNQQLTTDGTVTKALFTCNEGYSLTGSPEMSCQRTGLWEIHTSIKCGRQNEVVSF